MNSIDVPFETPDGTVAEVTTGAGLMLPGTEWRKLLAWARASDLEVSGVGLIDVAEGDLAVSEVFLLPQASNEVETRLDPGAMALFLQQLVEAGIDPTGLRLWWHSHARETAFWSGLDEQTIASFAPHPIISLVVDHAGHGLAREDSFEPRATRLLDVRLVGEVEPLREKESRAAGREVHAAVDRLAGPTSLRLGGPH